MRKNILQLLIILFISAFNLNSKPIISYITPDIGAPGMSVYVEIIGPHNKKNNFGNDGIYLLSTEKVKIIFKNEKDKEKITVGPIIVSWEGRMISTIFYINEALNPNSVDALLVAPEFQIQFAVNIDKDTSNFETFYIVKSRPYLNCDLFPNDSIFGDGNLGKRSPRGAMIFDSIKLSNRKYRVSVKDCDPNTPGNQGYLPFILLVNGDIKGSGSLSTISVNGGDNIGGLSQDGGPGGGGGGGSFVDVITGNRLGFRGGNGFTGGGPGGRNNSGLGLTTNEYTKPPSEGSGPYIGSDDRDGGYSLNGIPGARFGAFESSGGGTGHPFGLSGEPCSSGNNCSPNGGYGGGSGYRQNRPGGSGGYSTDGSNTDFGNNGGKAHGNIMVVPIAGGSGGGSGNPNGVNELSGAGGGGGGAIRIFAKYINNVKFTANGANGAQNDGFGYGGSGSGGHIGFQTKLGSNLINISVDGGINPATFGGTGRIRYDSPINFNLNLSTANASIYQGTTTDTSHIIRSNHILKGSQANGKTTNIYGKAPNQEWSLIGQVTQENWNLDLSNFLKNSGFYYIAAATVVDNPRITDYSSEPHFVLSQAANNILKLELRSFCTGDKYSKAEAIHCIGDTLYLKAKIGNKIEAEDNLELNLTDNWLIGDNGFKLLSPRGKYFIAPGKIAEIIVTFTLPIGADPSQSYKNYLVIPSNDPDYPPGKDWIIEFEVFPAFSPKLSYYDNDMPPYLFYDTKVGKSNLLTFQLINTGNSKLYVTGVNPLPLPFEIVNIEPSLPTLINIFDTLTITVKFSPKEEGVYKGIVTVVAEKTNEACPLQSHTEIIGKAIAANIKINKMVLDYGNVPYCKEITDTIKISNPSTATSSFQITKAPIIRGPYSNLFKIIKSPNDNTPIITPGDGVQYEILFQPDKNIEGEVTAEFYFTTDETEFSEIVILLKANIVKFNVVSNPININLGNVPIGFDLFSNFTLTNLSEINEKIYEIKTINNQNTEFEILNNFLDSIVYANSGSSNVRFIYKNLQSGSFTDTIFVIFDEPCLDTLKIAINGFGVISNPIVNIDDEPIIINLDTLEKRETSFGSFPKCYKNQFIKTLKYNNKSGAPYILISEELISNPSGRFSLDNSLVVYPDTVNTNQTKNGSQLIFNPFGADVGNYTAIVNIKLYVNGKIYSYKINLLANVYEGKFIIIPQNFQINATVNKTNTGQLTITNIGPENLEIKNLIGPFNPTIFSIQPDPTGIILLPNQSQIFTISFAPKELMNYKDSIIINSINSNCDSTFVIYLNGNAEPSKQLIVYFDSLIVEPNLKNYKIPLYAKFVEPNDELRNFNLEITTSFNRSLFFPTNIEQGNILSNIIVNNNRQLVLRFNNVDITPSDSIIGYIIGHTMLGEVDKTILEINNLNIIEKEQISNASSINGSLSIFICDEGGKRLLNHQFTPLNILVTPNPANDIVNISINTLEIGYHKLEITDIRGKLIYQIDWFSKSNNENKNIQIINNFSNGVYFINVYSPTQVINKVLNVIR